jgi:tetratricopeptide (TPR) repeat protein
MAMARPSGFEDRMRALLERRPRGPSSRAGRTAAAALVVLALALSTARPTAANPTTLKSLASVLHPRESWYERGKALHDEGRYEDAIEAFSRAIEAGQREGAATYNIACGLARLGHKDLAFEWLHKAEEAGFDVGAYLERDDDLDSLRSDPRYLAMMGERARDGSRSAFAFKFDKHKNKSESREESVERRFEKMAARSGEPWYQIGKELLYAHSYAHAAEAFAQAAARLEKKGAALYNRSCALAHLGEKREALDELRRAVEAGFTDASHIKSDDDLDSLHGDRRFDDAVALAEELALPSLKSGGEQSDRDAAKWREAAARFEELARRSGKLGLAFYNAGFARLAAGDLEQASTDFTRSLDLSYRRSASLYNLGCVEARRGDKDRAFRYLDRALEAGFGPQQLQSDRDLESLRSDPRFDSLVRRAENRVSANN